MTIDTGTIGTGTAATGAATTGTATTGTGPQSSMTERVGEQASQVASTAKDEARSLMDQGRGEMRQMMSQRSQQAAQGMRRLSEQLGSLAAGRPEQAERLQGYLDQAKSRMDEWAGRLESGGIDGVMADVKQYARRKPGMFLMGAAGAGFVIGRMLRVGATADSADRPHYGSTTGGTGGMQNGVRGVGGQGWVDSTASGAMVNTQLHDSQRDDPTVVVTSTGGDPW